MVGAHWDVFRNLLFREAPSWFRAGGPRPKGEAKRKITLPLRVGAGKRCFARNRRVARRRFRIAPVLDALPCLCEGDSGVVTEDKDCSRRFRRFCALVSQRARQSTARTDALGERRDGWRKVLSGVGLPAIEQGSPGGRGIRPRRASRIRDGPQVRAGSLIFPPFQRAASR